jgi:hypothetical protein
LRAEICKAESFIFPHHTACVPLRYVLLHKQVVYDAKYSTEIRGVEAFFRQVNCEESLVHFLSVNVLKRMESAVSSSALTVKRQMADVEATFARIKEHAESVEEEECEKKSIECLHRNSE